MAVGALKATTIEHIISEMKKEVRGRNPPVFLAEEKTRGDPFKTLVFTFLSARTRDEVTIKAVEEIFSKYPDAESISKIRLPKLEKMLFGIGFYRTKAKNLKMISQYCSLHGVPDTLEKLVELPGVGRKTANIVLARAFGKNTIGVDVHVHRISNRIGIVNTKNPEETERELVRIVPKKLVRTLNRNMVAFGQTFCTPRNPKCSECRILELCRYGKNYTKLR